MKVLCSILPRNDKILKISDTLKSMGHDVVTIYQLGYRQQCSYPMKKLDELGFSSWRKKYEAEKRKEFRDIVGTLKPNVILFINYVPEFVSEDDLHNASKSSRVILWAVDSLSNHDEIINAMSSYEIYVYEPSDIEILNKRIGKTAKYCPIGYNSLYEIAPNVRGGG